MTEAQLQQVAKLRAEILQEPCWQSADFSLSLPITEVPFSKRTYNVLLREGVCRLSQVTKFSQGEMLNWSGFGVRSVAEVLAALELAGTNKHKAQAKKKVRYYCTRGTRAWTRALMITAFRTEEPPARILRMRVLQALFQIQKEPPHAHSVLDLHAW